MKKCLRFCLKIIGRYFCFAAADISALNDKTLLFPKTKTDFLIIAITIYVCISIEYEYGKTEEGENEEIDLKKGFMNIILPNLLYLFLIVIGFRMFFIGYSILLQICLVVGVLIFLCVFAGYEYSRIKHCENKVDKRDILKDLDKMSFVIVLLSNAGYSYLVIGALQSLCIRNSSLLLPATKEEYFMNFIVAMILLGIFVIRYIVYNIKENRKTLS